MYLVSLNYMGFKLPPRGNGLKLYPVQRKAIHCHTSAHDLLRQPLISIPILLEIYKAGIFGVLKLLMNNYH